MIAKNEAGTLAHCLQSVRGLVDEIVVVDTGSTDATREIALGFGARLGAFPWVDDFAAARNASLDLCTGDWVLVLDADEAVDAADHATIRQACREAGPQAYRLTLRNYLKSGDQATMDASATPNDGRYDEGRAFPYFADFQGLRLCRRLPGLGFQGRIHELMDPFFLARHLPIESLGAVIHHFGKLLDDREAFKQRYYLELALLDARREPEKAQFQFNLVQQALAARDWPVAVEAARSCIRLQGTVHSMVVFGLGMALQNLDRHAEALEAFQLLMEANPGHAMGLTHRGISLALLGRTSEARASIRRAIAVQPGFALPYSNLAELETLVGDLPAARAALEEGLRACPRDPKLLHQRVLQDLRNQDQSKAVQDAAQALERCPQGGEGLWHQLVALDRARGSDPAGARRTLEAGLALFPDHEGLKRLQGMI